MPQARPLAVLAVCAAALALGGCDPRDCYLGIAHEDCYAPGSPLAAFPQDDAICRDYGLAPGTHDYAVCRQEKRHVRDLTDRESDFGFLKIPLSPDVTVVAPTPPPPR